MSSIAVLGTLDTKGDEHAFVAQLIRQRGHTPLLIDVGTAEPPRVRPDLTREEVAARVAAAGFGAWQAQERRIPYMCSPASRHGRLETVLTFSAEKQGAAPAMPAPAAEPDWLRSSDRPVPALPEFQQAALSMRVYGYLATLVDGRRSLAELAQVVVADRLMLPQDAEPALRGFLRRLYDDSRRPWRP